MAVTEACCADQPDGNCDSGSPVSCPQGCATVVRLFAKECKAQLKQVPGFTATINKAVASCHGQSGNKGKGGGTVDGSSRDGLYVAIDQKIDRAAALAFCRTHHHDLASIHCTAQNDLVREACADINHATNPFAGCWIGLSDDTSEGAFSWSDGTSDGLQPNAEEYVLSDGTSKFHTNRDGSQTANNHQANKDFVVLSLAMGGEHGSWYTRNGMHDAVHETEFVCQTRPNPGCPPPPPPPASGGEGSAR
jgi:hypothetical protein